jgi:hypothetical protein
MPSRCSTRCALDATVMTDLPFTLLFESINRLLR